MSVWALGATEVRWVAGGLLVRHGRTALLLDAPLGVSDAVAPSLPIVHGVVLSSGRMASVRGLLALLEAASRSRGPDAPLTVISPAADERVPAIVDVWTRGWPGRYPVHVDALTPGDATELGDVEVTLLSVTHGEPDPRSPDGVSTTPGCAIHVRTPDALIAWVPGAAPGPAVRRACRGSQLAVVEVGVVDWPATEHPWRLTLDQALEAAADADCLWVVGDDGHELGAANA